MSKVTFTSTDGEPVTFEDADPNVGLVSVRLTPSASVDDESPEMSLLLKREESGWVTRSKAKKESE